MMALRPIMARMLRGALPVPRHVRLERAVLGGVVAETLSTSGADQSAGVLYLHGGGFVAGAPANHRALTWRMAHGLGVPVHALDYRLAPEHPFPAALDDVVAAYRGLVERGVTRVALAGDSAGGNLTLTGALRLKRAGLPPPVALAAISPVTTLTEELPSELENADLDAMLPPGLMDSVIAHYALAEDPADALMSPLHATDLAGLPPTLLQCSADEMLRDHSIRMAERLRAAGVETELEVTPGTFHVWHVAADLVPESRLAITRMLSFLRPRLRSPEK